MNLIFIFTKDLHLGMHRFLISIKIPELSSLKDFTFHKNVLNLSPPSYFETK